MRNTRTKLLFKLLFLSTIFVFLTILVFELLEVSCPQNSTELLDLHNPLTPMRTKKILVTRVPFFLNVCIRLGFFIIPPGQFWKTKIQTLPDGTEIFED